MSTFDYSTIKRCAAQCRFTEHARQEMEGEPFGAIRVEEVLQSLEAGEILEEYPEDFPYPSCLVLGRTKTGRALHVVCAPVLSEDRLIIITTYHPDPNLWDSEFRRRLT